jgi:hypothetical protein
MVCFYGHDNELSNSFQRLEEFLESWSDSYLREKDFGSWNKLVIVVFESVRIFAFVPLVSEQQHTFWFSFQSYLSNNHNVSLAGLLKVRHPPVVSNLNHLSAIWKEKQILYLIVGIEGPTVYAAWACSIETTFERPFNYKYEKLTILRPLYSTALWLSSSSPFNNSPAKQPY